MVTWDTMKTLCALLFLLQNTLGHEVTEQLDDIPNNATTTLYPVGKKNTNDTKTITDTVENESVNKNTKLKSEASVWKLETAYAESKLAKKEEDNGTEIEPEDDKAQNRSEGFKPSPHLGDFFDFGSLDGPISAFSKENFQPYALMNKKPFEGFKGSNQKKHPSPPEFPYKFDSHKSPWRAMGGTGTGTGPGAVPAGSLYQSPAVQPGDADFAIDYNGELAFKEQGMKKRVNPWHGIARMLSALIPTAIIVSALTPSVISVEHMRKPYPTRLTRSAPREPPRLPPQQLQAPISERCRRRLLCELQADEHYRQSHQKDLQLSSSCKRYRCEDPSALAPLITWLLQPRQRNGVATGNKVT